MFIDNMSFMRKIPGISRWSSYDSSLSLPRAQIQSLVRELRSSQSHDVAKNNKQPKTKNNEKNLPLPPPTPPSPHPHPTPAKLVFHQLPLYPGSPSSVSHPCPQLQSWPFLLIPSSPNRSCGPSYGIVLLCPLLVPHLSASPFAWTPLQ